MRKYLATLHERPDHHKKQFAFIVSSTFTAILFVSWAVVKFGVPNMNIAKTEKKDLYTADTRTTEVSPVETLRASVNDAWNSLTGSVSELKNTAKSVNVGDKYEEIRSDALNSYGQ